jgi:hypothetical protein
MRNKIISLIGASAALLSVAGCTTAQETAVVDAVKAICLGLATGATAAITIISSLTGATTALSIANTVSSDINGVCTELETNLTSIISAITGSGGTATVSVSSSSAASVRLLAAHLRANFANLKVTAQSSGQITFVVPPSNNILGL